MKLRDLLGGFGRAKGADELREEAKQAFAAGDNAAGAAALLKIGEAADPEVCFLIGECYETARGVLPNFATAASWYERAAQKGHLRAQERLGDFYLFGRRLADEDGGERASR